MKGWLLIPLLAFFWLGADCLTVEGQNGSQIFLPCNLSHRKVSDILLTFGHFKAYGVKQHIHFRDRVDRNGSCNFILKDLKTTDAGKYTSTVKAEGYTYNNYYDVHINVKLAGQKGKELVLDCLPHETERVEHSTNTGSTRVWKYKEGVLTNRLTDKNGYLIIKNFTSDDTGTYRALNSTGGVLVTWTVTESMNGPSSEQSSGSSVTRVSWSVALLVASFVSVGLQI
ncbi:hypothetical protein QQF64_012958 [Cirrhinus molitorella]|uniref:Uncharacterized protein n=1 Tax=Cirrhinus molitorella TaxID=172907 RepID=A0ABR3LPS3_9TELE